MTKKTRIQSHSNGGGGGKKKSALNKSLKRVRKLSKQTENMGKAMLDGLGVASGSVMGPLVLSKLGQTFFSLMPGEVLLASLDVVEKQALQATSEAIVRAVLEKYGESVEEATRHAVATTEHCAGTASNVFKIRKAINPASSVSSGVLKSAETFRKTKPRLGMQLGVQLRQKDSITDEAVRGEASQVWSVLLPSPSFSPRLQEDPVCCSPSHG